MAHLCQRPLPPLTAVQAGLVGPKDSSHQRGCLTVTGQTEGEIGEWPAVGRELCRVTGAMGQLSHGVVAGLLSRSSGFSLATEHKQCPGLMLELAPAFAPPLCPCQPFPAPCPA